jgi:glycosyltransferase involved in cell wall biosynthesis
MYHGKSVAVVMPAYNEADGIADTIRAFQELPEVDEIIVADNNSTDGTAEIASAAGARVRGETRQGYGFACRRAMISSTSEITILVESDSTFRPTDLYKFLAYSGEFDVVFGTRTSKSCIWKGANMGTFLRYGNCAVAKFLEYLHNGPCLTDVGCTYKMFNRRALDYLSPLLTVGGSSLSPEIMLLAIRSGLTCVEIPVHYGQRAGTSKITGSFWKAFRLGWRMIGLIMAYRFKHIGPGPVTEQPLPVAACNHSGPRASSPQHVPTTR